MKSLVGIFILLIAIFSFSSASAFEGVCYNPVHLNADGNTLEEICVGGQIYQNFSDITGTIIHSTPIGAYKPGRISTGTFLPQSNYNQTPVGYWGNTFSDRIIKMPANNTPVGMFQKYKKTNIFFPTQEEKSYSSKKVFFPGQKPQGGGSTKNTISQCTPPQALTNQKIEMVNNGYNDQIKISFDPIDKNTQVKVVQIFPQSEVVFLAAGKYEYRATPKYADQNYQYILVSYNACNEMWYSNVLSITTGTQEQKNLDQTVLTNGKALSLITNESHPLDRLYYIFPSIGLDDKLTAGNLALFIVNLKANIVMEDSGLALKSLQSLGIIDAEKTPQSSVNLGELQGVLEKIQRSSSFQQDFFSALNNVFSLTNATAYGELQRLFMIENLLKNTIPVQQDILKDCFAHIQCVDIPLYQNFMAQLEIQLKNKESTALQLGININTNTIMTFSDYIFMLFEIIGQDDVLTGKYNLSEYTKFMTILRDAVVMGQTGAEDTMSYIQTVKFSQMLLDSKVFSKVSFITHNYLRTVNDIYAVVEKRGELFGILSDYLGE